LRIDLHCHTNASDGVLTPAEMLLRAEVMQLDVLAITDHDSVQGYQQALQLQQAQLAALPEGKSASKQAAALQLLSGVEFSTSWQGFEIHILGWRFAPDHEQMVQLLNAQREQRHQRSELIHERLLKNAVAAEHLPTARPNLEQGGGVRTRLHYADALLKHGYVATKQQAFERFLGKGQCAYVKPQWCSMEEAVKVIHASGGVASIAHPLAYDMSTKWLRRLITDFKGAGGVCMEVVSGQQAPEQRQWLSELAREYNLLASAGSDFHFPGRWRELGRNLQMPEGLTPVWHDWFATERTMQENQG